MAGKNAIFGDSLCIEYLFIKIIQSFKERMLLLIIRSKGNHFDRFF